MRIKLSMLILVFSSLNVMSAPEENIFFTPVQDTLCPSGAVYCTHCDSTILNGCFFTDAELLLNGIISCSPEFIGPGPQEDQPSPLCYGAGVPHNMSWFAFEASDTLTNIIIAPFECNLDQAVGLQSGVYDLCAGDGGQCIGGNPFCSEGLDPIEYVVEHTIPGNIYYLFVDGCNGAECEFEIIINPAPSCIVDTPKAIKLESSCPPVDGVITYCTLSEFDLDITHFGDALSYNGIYDDENSTYNPALKLNYRWYVNPPFMGDDTIVITKEENGLSIVDLLKDNDENINYEICLISVESECDTKACDNCCLNIILEDCGDDFDQDGFNIHEDCNDCDASINPEAEEVPDNDIDENCDGDLDPTSTNELAEHNFTFFPNPFKDEVHFNTTYIGDFLVNVFNAQGILVESQTTQKSISLTHLPAGTYVLKINFPTEDSSIVRKILKL